MEAGRPIRKHVFEDLPLYFMVNEEDTRVGTGLLRPQVELARCSFCCVLVAKTGQETSPALREGEVSPLDGRSCSHIAKGVSARMGGIPGAILQRV